MIGWAITFLVIALIAGLLGFGAIAGTAFEFAKIIFFVAIILFAISRGGRPHARAYAGPVNSGDNLKLEPHNASRVVR